ncbi:glycosyltransferase [Natronomonas sp. CBA1123]|uniref:glycosyltransferase family 4 protein n=1 Tax=Natronomonas sp. CBA1123 TaxID=2668070 RepID=UPI0012EA3B4A|nr:glycosyltransferase family 4 protein [Natronomonas sp. CBA1123]MUV85123.1 glycosyltransferase [Natronomonas sp. CBA1123]
MKEPVRLVYLINSLNVGGAETGMCRLLNGLDEERYEVTVVALNEISNELDDQIPTWVRILRLYSDSPDLRETIDFIQAARKADVIVGSLFHAAMVAKLVGVLNRDATVATWRHACPFKTRFRKTVFKLTTGLTDVILADSTAVADTLTDEVGLDISKVHTVPIAGLDLSEYTMVDHQQSSDITVGSVGRLTEPKNFETVLLVAERLQETGITFEIAGDGKQYEELEQIIDERSISNVTLCGFVDDVPRFLSQLDIYFQPSRWEGLCITVLEAMATGLPVVGSNVGGIEQNIEHNLTGLLFSPNDVGGFAQGIRKLSTNPQKRNEFGKRARQIVTNQFTRKVLVSDFERSIDTYSNER